MTPPATTAVAAPPAPPDAATTAPPAGAVVRQFATLTLAGVAISASFTNYGPLIQVLQDELHASAGQVGLLSTALYVGIGICYLPGGMLADRAGSRRVLTAAL